MLVLVFRHGPAGEADPLRWPDDGKRPLTAPGIEKTRRAARGLARFIPRRPRILSSPLVRAHETAQLLSEAFDPPVEVEILDALAPGGTVRAAIAALGASRDEDAVVVLVGHQPGLGKLAGSMVFEGGAEIPLKKAGACAVAFEEKPVLGRGDLLWLATPRMLRAVGGKKESRLA